MTSLGSHSPLTSQGAREKIKTVLESYWHCLSTEPPIIATFCKLWPPETPKQGTHFWRKAPKWGVVELWEGRLLIRTCSVGPFMLHWPKKLVEITSLARTVWENRFLAPKNPSTLKSQSGHFPGGQRKNKNSFGKLLALSFHETSDNCNFLETVATRDP